MNTVRWALLVVGAIAISLFATEWIIHRLEFDRNGNVSRGPGFHCFFGPTMDDLIEQVGEEGGCIGFPTDPADGCWAIVDCQSIEANGFRVMGGDPVDLSGIPYR